MFVGCTSNIDERLRQHHYKRKRKWSGRQQGEWKLVHREKYQNKHDALIREKELKKQKSHKYIESLIHANAVGSSISPVCGFKSHRPRHTSPWNGVKASMYGLRMASPQKSREVHRTVTYVIPGTLIPGTNSGDRILNY